MWSKWIAVSFLLLVYLATTESDSHDPFAQQPRIVVQDGNLIFKSADNRNVSLSSGNRGHVKINEVDMNSILTTVRNGGSMAPSDRIGTYNQQWRTNVDLQLTVLEDNVTALSSKVNQFSGPGQEPISNKRLRRFMGKVQMLTEKVNRLNQLLYEDECSSNPCRNGGTCVDHYNGFSCRCPSNWEGTTCESDVNECAQNAGSFTGCQNGATCYNSPGSYRCECMANWYGIHCTEQHDDCSMASHEELCGHGHCVDDKRVQPGQPKYRCDCDEGWRKGISGPACSEDVDECADGKIRCSQNPRVECRNYPGGFTCGSCPAGYSGNGYSCYDIDECLVNNGGCDRLVQCNNTIGSRTCGSCPPGYHGNGQSCYFVGVCNINHGGCHPLAQCIPNAAITATHRVCQCPQGYVGSGEGLNGCVAAAGMSCASNPCQHGTCQMSENSVHCTCHPGYYGTLCNQQLDPCFSNPCQNGGRCVTNQGSYTCICLEAFEGATCADRKRGCGGYLNEDNGTLRHPFEIGQEYRNGENCEWVISVNETKVINVTVNHFNTERSSNCQNDYVQFNDGSSDLALVLGRFCGSGTHPDLNFTSTHHQLYIRFRSNEAITGTGFELTWNATRPSCGGVLEVADSGSVNSPGYPGKYPRNRNCTWLVQVPLGKRINFQFATLKIEHHTDCNYDYLEIYDGESTNDPVLQKFCGSQTPPALITSGHAALIYFHSDVSEEDNGFHITYASLPGIPGCGGLHTAPTGSMASPNFPDYYASNVNCEWLIRVHPNNRILLNFSDFHLENSTNCKYDFVEIFDGETESSPLIGRYCGNTVPSDILSNAHHLFIKFKTDPSIAHQGFRLRYRTVCGGLYTELNGVLSSPYFPDPYPAKAMCIYDIRLPMGYIVNITFNTFDLEGYDCRYDYLQIRDGGADNSPLIGTLCGSGANDEIVSTYNQVWMKFVSDASNQRLGFLLQYEAIQIGCGGIMTEDTGEISSPMHPSSYPNAITCMWYLKAPPGFMIRLVFQRFEIEPHPECNYDHVIVQDSNGAQIGKYCNVKRPPPILTSAENSMFVKFVSDTSVARDGFVASYEFLDASRTCGGDFYTNSGVLRTPRYPQNYPHNTNCVWVIHADDHHQILLNVTSFELENNTKCIWDYLEIRNGGYENSPKIGRYCGTKIMRSITSQSNAIRLEFKSDFSSSHSGFEIYYDSTTIGCGGTLSTTRGTIVSPNYPQPYPTRADCLWFIRVSEGSRISLTVVDIDIEEATNCVSDYLQVFNGPSENSPVLASMCNNQQLSGAILSSTNKMALRFRSDASMHGSGFHIVYDTICNNILKQRRGVIESPNFPNDYPNNHNCSWTIIAPIGNNVTVSFSHIELEGGPDCDGDYIEIFEGKEELTSLAKYCGTPMQFPPQIKSTTHTVKIQLMTNNRGTRQGFRLEYEAQGCGGEIRERNNGVIMSPNFPNGYPFQTACLWHFSYRPGNRVELRITDLQLEHETNCMYDFLRVYSGEDETGPVLVNLCKMANDTQVVTSSGSEMVVHFHSDVSISRRGFRAFYKRLESGCGGYFTAAEATIMSPNHPSAYDLTSDCSWLIKVDINSLVILNFIEFNMPESLNCSHGHVSIYDGNNSSAVLLGKMCGSTKPNGGIVSATGNEMLVRLTSDGVNVATGFKAHYRTGCGRRLSADGGGEIISPHYPESTNSPFNCSWILFASNPDEKVTLLVTYLHSADENCQQSYFRVTDGDRPDSAVISEVCGVTHSPPAIVSRGNTLHVLLNTVTFRATYGVASSHCSGTFTSISGTIISPGYPDPYTTGMECIYVIQASAGSQVALSFQSFDLEVSDHCNLDYVEIHENDAAGKLIGRYCGNQIPDNLTASHRIWMKFSSDEEGAAPGFVVHYELLHGNDVNGTNGIIESPGYPLHLYATQYYSWTVTVPAGLSVSIRFLNINIDTIYHASACVSSVTVFDGIDETSPQLGSFCGYEIPEPAVSVGNVVFISFNLNGYGTWRLEWNAVNRSGLVVEEPIITGPENRSSCWQEFRLNSSTEVTLDSPNYPANYASYLNCTYIYQAPFYEHIELTFLEFELEGTHQQCRYDYVQIYVLPNPAVNDWHLNETLCDRRNITTFRTQNNMLKIVFITDASSNYKGFHATVKTECGGQISASEGVLTSTQILPHFRPHFAPMICEWQLTVKNRRTMQVTFDSFDVPSDSVCSSNYLMLRNGGSMESPVLGNGKYCGSTNPTVPESSSNKVHVKLAYTSATQSPQFALRFRELSIGCSQNYFLNEDVQSVVLSSPNFPSPPPADVQCIWVIMSPVGTRMRFDFETIHMNSQCIKTNLADEYVEMKDGGTASAPLLNRFCGHGQPPSEMTTGNALFVNYLTSVDHPEAGFQATVRTAECGGLVTGYKPFILSPHYPKNYTSSLECEWMLRMGAGYHIVLELLDLDTPQSDNCSLTDFVEIRHGDAQGEILATFCGQFVPGPNEIDVPGTQAYVKFKSNTAATGRGFKLQMKRKPDSCSNRILTTPSGQLSSPNYPDALTFRRECQWTIEGPEGRRVTLTFEHLDLPRDPATGLCISYIQVYNTTNWNRKRHAKMICGNELPLVVESSSSTIIIRFYTLGLAAGQGFSLTYTTDNEAVCGGALQLPSGVIETPPFQVSNNTWVDCKWKTSPVMQNQTLTFQFDVFDLPADVSNYCLGSTFYLRKEPRDGSYFGNLCGNYTNKALMVVSSSPFTIAKLVANLSLPITGIRGTYNVSDCGGYVDGEDAVITSPGYPNGYPPNTTCFWTIVLPAGVGITLTTVDMRLETNCDKDYVIVRNGDWRNSPIVGKFCGTDLPHVITTRRNKITILFHADEFGTAPGFKMTTSEVQRGCGGLIHLKKGTIKSPNHPQRYGPNVECIWTIEMTPGFTVNLTFVGRFDIEMANDCNKDYLLIEKFDGVSWSRVEDKKCGRETPPPIETDSRTVRLTFRSDADIGGDGFEIKHVAKCGDHFTNTNGEIRSPNYPYEYDDNLNCEYLFGQPGHYVTITFDAEQFSLESSNNCIYDRIEIFEGNTTSAPSLGRSCGTVPPDTTTILGPVLVKFITDYIVSARGFVLHYEIIACGGVFTEPNGVLTTTPSSMEKHPHNMDCKWLIQGQPNKVIAIKFIFFDVAATYQCYSDWLEIRDGNETAPLIGTLCGNRVPPIVKSNGNQMFLHFHSTDWFNMKGFSAAYFNTLGPQQGCGGTVTQDSGEITSVDTNSDGLYESELDCSWLIIGTTTDTILKLEFVELDVEAADNGSCIHDFVEIRENMGPKDALIGRFCGDVKPPPLIASGNKVSVYFHSDDTNNKPGFKIKFSSVASPCGASSLHVTQSAQTLSSPNYPNPYPTNMRCRWNFNYNSTALDRIQIKITYLDIPCTGDYLEIQTQPLDYRMRMLTASPRRYCGPIDNYYLITENGVSLIFHSDAVSEGGHGFSLIYKLEDCNTMYVTDNGNIFSPGFPQYTKAGTECAMTIMSQPGKTIALYFESFYMSNYRDTDCTHAGLQIYDGFNASAPLLRKLCKYYNSIALFSTGHILHLQLSLPQTQAAFAVSYTTTSEGRGCGGDFTQDQGMFTSPFYPAPYNQTAVCKWRIAVPGYHSVRIMFASFSLTSTGIEDRCESNYLEIFEGSEDVPEKRMSLVCAGDYPASHSSVGSQVLVKLVTSPSNRGEGFLMYYRTEDFVDGSIQSVMQASSSEIPVIHDSLKRR